MLSLSDESGNQEAGISGDGSQEAVHRLPSQSLSTVLQRLESDEVNFGTGISSIDKITRSGVIRGKVTELCGPPGSGKTSFGLQIAATVIRYGLKVLWIDTSSIFPVYRLQQALPGVNIDSQVYRLQITSLAALLVFFMDPPSYLSSYGLVIVDDFSTLIFAAFTSTVDQAASSTAESSQWDNGHVDKLSQNEKRTSPKREDFRMKRLRAISELLVCMANVAESRNFSLLVLTQAVSRISDGEAKLVCPLGEGQHIAPLWTRGVLFRSDVELQLQSTESAKRGQAVTIRGVPHVCITKCAGVKYEEPLQLAAFRITSTGFQDAQEWYDEILYKQHQQRQSGTADLKLSKFDSVFLPIPEPFVNVVEHDLISSHTHAPTIGSQDTARSCGTSHSFLSPVRIKPSVIYDIEELLDEDFLIDEEDLL
ncbi:P-loop containing nucleoside triphosphate hydrolase protein [Lipomyces arxii]|uniref:P-loop containing nucleoside triphosphate hydrolase protein n=1 Tax=Lipomyces arxii TaxID=56418 RepID=UPI0034CFED95